MKKVFLICLSLTLAISSFAQFTSIYPQGLKVGEIAPQLTGIDQHGKKINLKEILEKGEVVLVFYRGQWCPYCNKELSAINDELQTINTKGATVIAITPETTENINKTIEKTNVLFSIIQDDGLTIMKNYKVNFTVDEATLTKYKNYGIDFEKVNGSNGSNLPIPATYIIGKNRKIKYVFFDPDYKKRASVQDIIENL